MSLAKRIIPCLDVTGGRVVNVFMEQVSPANVEILRQADAIVREEIKKAGLEREIWQAFAVLPDIRLIFLARDPIDRAVSHFLHNVHKGRVTNRAVAEALRFAGSTLRRIVGDQRGNRCACTWNHADDVADAVRGRGRGVPATQTEPGDQVSVDIQRAAEPTDVARLPALPCNGRNAASARLAASGSSRRASTSA